MNRKSPWAAPPVRLGCKTGELRIHMGVLLQKQSGVMVALVSGELAGCPGSVLPVQTRHS